MLVWNINFMKHAHKRDMVQALPKQWGSSFPEIKARWVPKYPRFCKPQQRQTPWPRDLVLRCEVILWLRKSHGWFTPCIIYIYNPFPCRITKGDKESTIHPELSLQCRLQILTHTSVLLKCSNANAMDLAAERLCEANSHGKKDKMREDNDAKQECMQFVSPQRLCLSYASRYCYLLYSQRLKATFVSQQLLKKWISYLRFFSSCSGDLFATVISQLTRTWASWLGCLQHCSIPKSQQHPALGREGSAGLDCTALCPAQRTATAVAC